MPIHINSHQEDHHHRHHDHPLIPPPQAKPKPGKVFSLLLKSIIMAFILSLFLLFISFAAIVFIHFLLTTTTLRRQRQRQRNCTTPTPTSSHSPQDLQKFLPRLRFASSFQTARDCSICLEGFKEGDWCRILPDCNHLFHESCVDKWLTKVPNCPVCRTQVRLDWISDQ